MADAIVKRPELIGGVNIAGGHLVNATVARSLAAESADPLIVLGVA